MKIIIIYKKYSLIASLNVVVVIRRVFVVVCFVVVGVVIVVVVGVVVGVVFGVVVVSAVVAGVNVVGFIVASQLLSMYDCGQGVTSVLSLSEV